MPRRKLRLQDFDYLIPRPATPSESPLHRAILQALMLGAGDRSADSLWRMVTVLLSEEPNFSDVAAALLDLQASEHIDEQESSPGERLYSLRSLSAEIYEEALTGHSSETLVRAIERGRHYDEEAMAKTGRGGTSVQALARLSLFTRINGNAFGGPRLSPAAVDTQRYLATTWIDDKLALRIERINRDAYVQLVSEGVAYENRMWTRAGRLDFTQRATDLSMDKAMHRDRAGHDRLIEEVAIRLLVRSDSSRWDWYHRYVGSAATPVIRVLARLPTAIAQVGKTSLAYHMHAWPEVARLPARFKLLDTWTERPTILLFAQAAIASKRYSAQGEARQYVNRMHAYATDPAYAAAWRVLEQALDPIAPLDPIDWSPWLKDDGWLHPGAAWALVAETAVSTRERLDPAVAEGFADMQERLNDLGMTRLYGLVRDALGTRAPPASRTRPLPASSPGGNPPTWRSLQLRSTPAAAAPLPPPPPPPPAWEIKLQELAAIAPPAPQGTAEPEQRRLIWLITTNSLGQVESIHPCWQRQEPNGWSSTIQRCKPESLLELSLEPHDAKVLRHLRRTSLNEHALVLSPALESLVGNSNIALMRNSDRVFNEVKLVAAEPAIEVITRKDGSQVLQMRPPVLPGIRESDILSEGTAPGSTASIANANLWWRVIREGGEHALLVRFTPAQQRLAWLLGEGLTVPPSGSGKAHEALKALQLHTTVLKPDDTFELADPSIRVVLSRYSKQTNVTFVVAPLGDDGPRMDPGKGRHILTWGVGPKRRTVRRDLAAETNRLDALRQSCPSAFAPQEQDGEPTSGTTAWTTEELLTCIAELQGAQVPIEWRGNPVKTRRIGLPNMRIRVTTASDWLTMEGELVLDEQVVASLQELLRTLPTSAGRYRKLGEDDYLLFSDELVERTAELARMTAGDSRGRVPALAAQWLQGALEGSQATTDAGFARKLALLDDAQTHKPPPPPGLMAELRPYQLAGFQFLASRASAGLGAVLADDMGTGKTVICLALLLERAHRGPSLVLAPTSLVGEWAKEAARFAPSLRVHSLASAPDRLALVQEVGAGDVVVASYSLAVFSSSELLSRRWSTLVKDEAHALKNIASKRTAVVFELQADARVALTGTPIENRLTELWAVMHAVLPGLLGPVERFKERFSRPIEREDDEGARKTLRSLLSAFILRRTKAQVLPELPPKISIDRLVESTPAERALYEAVRRTALEDAERAAGGEDPARSRFNVLAAIMRMRRAACDPRLINPEADQGPKLRAALDLLDGINEAGHACLVFSTFVDLLGLLRESLDKKGLRYTYLDGSTPAKDRPRLVDSFQSGEGGQVFLCSLTAGGVGLTLTRASYVIVLDPWWNPQAERQATDRAHRIGQANQVTVYRVISAGTIEERIVRLQAEKLELATSILDDQEGSASSQLSIRELIDLMRGP